VFKKSLAHAMPPSIKSNYVLFLNGKIDFVKTAEFSLDCHPGMSKSGKSSNVQSITGNADMPKSHLAESVFSRHALFRRARAKKGITFGHADFFPRGLIDIDIDNSNRIGIGDSVVKEFRQQAASRSANQ
jgi:hypothetical protein